MGSALVAAAIEAHRRPPILAAVDPLQAALLLFMVLDPLGNVPLFAAALREVPAGRQRRVIARELLIALGILLAVLYAGQPVMAYLGLSPAALGIAGGLVLFLIGLRMIFPVHGGVFGDEEGGGEPLVVPLAVPLVAGPSAMATLMLLAGRDGSRLGTLTISLVLAWLASAAILLAAPWLARALGRRMLAACERLVGMLLVAVSVQQFLDGLMPLLRR
jgi:MarC family membrane protein